MWELFTWEGSQLLHTILQICFPHHWFYFLLVFFHCKWCTAICHHRNENIPHSDHALSQLSCYIHCFVALLPPMCQRNALARLAGQNSLHRFGVSTWIILVAVLISSCVESLSEWGLQRPSPFLLWYLLTKHSQFNFIPPGAIVPLVVYGVKNGIATQVKNGTGINSLS